MGFSGSIARNCGEMQIELLALPCALSCARERALVNDCVLEALFCENLRTPRTKRSFWNFLFPESDRERFFQKKRCH